MHDTGDPLHDLGWDQTFDAAFQPYRTTATPARVSRTDRGGTLTVETGQGVARARLAARFRRLDDPLALPTVGDWVTLGSDRIDGLRVVDGVLPRRGAIVRQSPEDRGGDAQVLAANVDTTLVVVAMDTAVNQRRIDRFLALAWQSDTTPVVVLSKADRAPGSGAVVAQVEAATLGVPVHPVSALSGEGLAALDPYLGPGTTAVLLGPSGAGKSTLANRLLGTERLATQALREDGRGRHTTTHRQLLRLPTGGVLIDTPGLRELGLWDADEGVAETFADVEALATGCRFGDCRHQGEPGCAVQAALDDGSLPADRLASYQKLQRELAHQARKQDVRLRQAEQRRWKQIHRELRDHPKLQRE